jgi:hypothetical protein
MELFLFITLVTFQVLDILTTLKILKLGGYEANPSMKKAMDALGVKTALIGIKVLYSLALLGTFVYLNVFWFWIIMNLFYLTIIVNNVKVMNKLR